MNDTDNRLAALEAQVSEMARSLEILKSSSAYQAAYFAARQRAYAGLVPAAIAAARAGNWAPMSELDGTALATIARGAHGDTVAILELPEMPAEIRSKIIDATTPSTRVELAVRAAERTDSIPTYERIKPAINCSLAKHARSCDATSAKRLVDAGLAAYVSRDPRGRYLISGLGYDVDSGPWILRSGSALALASADEPFAAELAAGRVTVTPCDASTNRARLRAELAESGLSYAAPSVLSTDTLNRAAE